MRSCFRAKDDAGSAGVYLSPANGGSARLILQDFISGQPTFSADGSFLLFHGLDYLLGSVKAIEMDGSSVQSLTGRPGAGSNPQPRPGSG